MVNASKPPADAPNPTIGNGFAAFSENIFLLTLFFEGRLLLTALLIVFRRKDFFFKNGSHPKYGDGNGNVINVKAANIASIIKPTRMSAVIEPLNLKFLLDSQQNGSILITSGLLFYKNISIQLFRSLVRLP